MRKDEESITVRVTAELKKSLKLYCIDNNTTLQRIIEQYLKSLVVKI